MQPDPQGEKDMRSNYYTHEELRYVNIEKFEPLLHDQPQLCTPSAPDNSSATIIMPFQDPSDYMKAKELWQNRNDLLFAVEDDSCAAGEHVRSMYRSGNITFDDDLRQVVIPDARLVPQVLEAGLNLEYAIHARMSFDGERNEMHANMTSSANIRRWKPLLRKLGRRGFFDDVGDAIEDGWKKLTSGVVSVATQVATAVISVAEPVVDEVGDCFGDLHECIHKLEQHLDDLLPLEFQPQPWDMPIETKNWDPREIIYEPSAEFPVGATLTCIECHKRGKFRLEGSFDFDFVGDKARCHNVGGGEDMSDFECFFVKHIEAATVTLTVVEEVDLQ